MIDDGLLVLVVFDSGGVEGVSGVGGGGGGGVVPFGSGAQPCASISIKPIEVAKRKSPDGLEGKQVVDIWNWILK